MKLLRPRGLYKPPCGSVLIHNNLANGLQIAAILNEGGGIMDSVGVVRNLITRHNASVVQSIGPNIGSLWLPTKQGVGFINRNTGTSGALDFGAISTYPSFASAVTMIVTAARYSPSSVSRVFVCANGSTGTMSQIVQSTTPTWDLYMSTASGLKGPFSLTPSQPGDPRFCDMIALTYDGVTLKGYLNGISKVSSTINSAISVDTSAHILLSGWNGSSGQNHAAPITVAYMWNRALNAGEIQQVYLNPYWVLTPGLGFYRGITASAPIPPTPTPSGGQDIPLIGNYAQSKSGFGINQKIIAIPEMSSFEEVRQVIARAVGELQNHIATQLPIIDYKQRKITNVAPPTEADDVVTLKYLQSVQLPAQPKSN